MLTNDPPLASPVDWHEGLLISDSHLIHTDSRIDRLFALACAVACDQPGVISLGQNGSLIGQPYQLLEIDNVQETVRGDSVEVSFVVNRPFRLLTPAGGIIQVMPNVSRNGGPPLYSLSTTVDHAPREGETVAIFISESRTKRCQIDASSPERGTLSLTSPLPTVQLAEPEALGTRSAVDCDHGVVAGQLIVSSEVLKVDRHFLPPLCRMGFIESFVPGTLARLKREFQILSDLVWQYTPSAGSVVSEPGLGATVRTRFMYLQILSGLLAGLSGRIHELDRISPSAFTAGFTQPLASWLDRYRHSLSSGAATEDISVLCDTVLSLDTAQVWRDTLQTVTMASDVITAVQEVVTDVA